MSLRLRLLVAVGLISIVALVVADFATYSALRTSLYNQVDQQLAQRPHPPQVDVATGNAMCQSPRSGGGICSRPGGNGGGGPTSGGPTLSVGAARSPNVIRHLLRLSGRSEGSVVGRLECPAYVGLSRKAALPSPIGGLPPQPNGSQVASFTTASIGVGWTEFPRRRHEVHRAGTTC